MDALDLIENLQAVNMRELAHVALTFNRDIMADLNANQLALGLRATGSKIAPAYHPLTIELKRERSGLAAITDRVTLYDTGAYYRSLYAEVRGEFIEYGARNWKEEKLTKKYGDTIHGLTGESKEELIEGHLYKSTLEIVREQTDL